MSEIFGIEGGGQRSEGGAKKKPPGEQDPKKKRPMGEGEKGRHMQYDNEMGAMMLDLPPRFSKYKAELEEDLMDAFYGESAGGNPQHASINEWIGEWMKKKEEEDPELRREGGDEADGY